MNQNYFANITLISVKATISYTEIRIIDEGKLCTYSNTTQSLLGCEDSCKGYKIGSKMKQISIFFLFLKCWNMHLFFYQWIFYKTNSIRSTHLFEMSNICFIWSAICLKNKFLKRPPFYQYNQSLKLHNPIDNNTHTKKRVNDRHS